MNAVGESNYQSALRRICGGHSRYGHELEMDALLEREPHNPHDSNAVAVTINGERVGYLPREQAARVATQMAEDGFNRAGCRAKIVGGWRTNQYDEGNFGVRLAVPCWGWIDFGIGKRPPASVTHQGRKNVPNRPEAAEAGPLKGQHVVIWGAPDDGDEAKELAALGARIMAGVGKSTTIVIHVDNELTPGMMGSSTYRKAQERIADGAELEIVDLKTLRSRISGLA